MKQALWFVLGTGLLLPAAARCQIGNIVVTSAASFQPGLPASGSIGTIFCTGLVVSGTVIAPGVPLPLSLAGVTVTVGSAGAPIFAVAGLGGYEQINFQVPLEAKFNPDGTVQVVVGQNGGQGSVVVSQPVQAGDFFRIAGTQFGVFQHALDYSLVTVDSPAKAGETIVAYATGLPTAVPQVATGQPAPISPLSSVPQSGSNAMIDLTGLVVDNRTGLPSYFEGDTAGGLLFMGLTPGAVGLYQINFVLPQGVPSGNVPIWLRRIICASGGPGFSCNSPGRTHSYDSQTVLIPVR